MKAPVPRPTLRLVDKVSRSCGHTPGKVAGQRATVKAEMNGVTPGLDRRPPPRWMGGQGGQSLKVLVRALSDFEVFSFSKLNNQNKFFPQIAITSWTRRGKNLGHGWSRRIYP